MRFTSKLSALALAAAGMAVSFGAQAQSIDVRVIGTITPPACTPTLAGGGVVDYGKIAASTLNMTSVNPLAEKTVAFSINCDAATKVALKTVDNRAASRVAGITSVLGAAYVDEANFGLGAVASANVGGYVLRLPIDGFTADGAAVRTIRASDAKTWRGQEVVTHTSSDLMSWALSGQPPLAFKNLTGTLAVQAVLNRGDALPLGDEIPLDGLATLELVYL